MTETDKLAKLIRHCLIWFSFIWLIALITPLYWLQSADETDSPDKRSGVRLITDYGTGCQYLQRGGITPRLDADGNHICK